MASDTVLYIEDDNKEYEIIRWRYILDKREKKSYDDASSVTEITECVMVINHEGNIDELTDWVTNADFSKQSIYITINPAQNKDKKQVIELVDVKCVGCRVVLSGIELDLLIGGMKQEDYTVASHWKTSPFASERSTDVETREEEEEDDQSIDGFDAEEDAPETHSAKLKTPEGGILSIPERPIDTDVDGMRDKMKKKSGIIFPGAPKIPEVPKVPKGKLPDFKMPEGGIYSIPDVNVDDIDEEAIRDKMKKSGVIFPDAPKVPKLSDAAKKHIPKDMQGVITDHPEDVLKNGKAEILRQDVVIAATNPKKGIFKTKALSAAKKLLSIGVPVIAIGGMAYSTYKSGKEAVEDIEKAGKWIKKRTAKAEKPAPVAKAVPKPVQKAAATPKTTSAPKKTAPKKVAKPKAKAKKAVPKKAPSPKAKAKPKPKPKEEQALAATDATAATATSEVAGGAASTAASGSKKKTKAPVQKKAANTTTPKTKKTASKSTKKETPPTNDASNV